MKCVYCLDFPDGKKYVGSASDLKQRLRRHNNPSHNKKRQPELKVAIANGYEVVILKVLPDAATIEDLRKQEQHYIDLWWDYGILYNKNKIAAAPPSRKGKTAWNKGIPQTAQRKAQHSAIMKGRKMSAEHIAKRSAALRHPARQHVNEIKERRATGETCTQIGKDYGCSCETIRQICLA